MDEKMETAALKQELATAKHELAEARAYIRRRILAEADPAHKESLARKIKHCDEIMEERDQALKERDEARAEVERLRELLDETVDINYGLKKLYPDNVTPAAMTRKP